MESTTGVPGASSTPEEFPLPPETLALLHQKWRRRWRTLAVGAVFLSVLIAGATYFRDGGRNLQWAVLLGLGFAVLASLTLAASYKFFGRKAMRATVGVRQSGPLRCWDAGTGTTRSWRIKVEGGPDLSFWERLAPHEVRDVRSGTVEWVKDGRLVIKVQDDAGTVLYQLT